MVISEEDCCEVVGGLEEDCNEVLGGSTGSDEADGLLKVVLGKVVATGPAFIDNSAEVVAREFDGPSVVVALLPGMSFSSSESKPSVQDHKWSRSFRTRTSWLHM